MEVKVAFLLNRYWRGLAQRHSLVLFRTCATSRGAKIRTFKRFSTPYKFRSFFRSVTCHRSGIFSESRVVDHGGGKRMCPTVVRLAGGRS